ncbi:winged helix-turn-helix transcriptional regulator [Candidatus Berkelbacteria bacterium]|nr:winged helix-turn-helix transcriptional regulator [Candidatus Berkelbacteria bacterium]
MAVNYRKIEKITKAVANHRRIQILDLLESRQRLSVVEISQQTRGNVKTIDAHVNRLFAVGMITKRTAGNRVQHTITKYGISILEFLRKQE